MTDTNRVYYTGDRPTFQNLIKHFEKVVEEAHKDRKKREEWFRYEMEFLLAAINWERAQLRKDPIPMHVLLIREAQAAGHSDYGHKLAIYAAELVLDKDGGP